MSQKINFIDFFDASQLYLDMIDSSCHAISHIANLNELDMLKSVSTTLDFAAFQLKDLFKKYSDLLKTDSGN